MDFQRGERVTLNFDTGGVEKLEQEENHEHFTPTFPTFVSDILERESSTAPVAPSLSGNKAGFPAHKKRIPRMSAFKQQRAAKEQQAAAAQKAQDAPKPRAGFDPKEEKQAIDKENRERLDAMSDAEIEEERQELLQGLSPALIQKLLMRSNIDDGSNERDLYPETRTVPALSHAADEVEVGEKPEAKSKPPTTTKTVSFASDTETEQPPTPQEPEPSPQPQHTQDPSTTPSTTTTSTQQDPHPTEDSIHFPHPPQPPDLDPNDPSFLTHLHTKYFPNLPYNPTSLSWMTPIDPSDTASAYHPSHSALAASDLRFDFTGALLPPSVARQIPTDRGLHHHADAPEAAGYTVPELAVLARSQVAAQRCMAYQTLGRVLYRLGKGEFGVERARQETDGPVQVAINPGEEDEDEDEDVGSAMAGGLWACVEEGRVIETMTEEAGRERGHLTARTFAQEALWNWRRGGGRKRHAV